MMWECIFELRLVEKIVGAIDCMEVSCYTLVFNYLLLISISIEKVYLQSSDPY